MKTKEELLKQVDELMELAKNLKKIDPRSRLPGTFMDKNDEMEKQGSSIQAGISAAGAAGGVPHTTPAGSTLGAIQAMGSSFGKAEHLDKAASKDIADKLRAIYGKASNKEESISANNNPDPALGKSEPSLKKDQGTHGSGTHGLSLDPGVSHMGVETRRAHKYFEGEKAKPIAQRIKETLHEAFAHQNISSYGKDKQRSARRMAQGTLKELQQEPVHKLPGAPKIGKSEALGKPVPKGVNPDKYDRCVEDVKRKGGAKNAYAVCASSLKKDAAKEQPVNDGVSSHESPSLTRTLSAAEKCADPVSDVINHVKSLKKGYFLP